MEVLDNSDTGIEDINLTRGSLWVFLGVDLWRRGLAMIPKSGSSSTCFEKGLGSLYNIGDQGSERTF
jgi:hypothetical protein